MLLRFNADGSGSLFAEVEELADSISEFGELAVPRYRNVFVGRFRANVVVAGNHGRPANRIVSRYKAPRKCGVVGSCRQVSARQICLQHTQLFCAHRLHLRNTRDRRHVSLMGQPEEAVPVIELKEKENYLLDFMEPPLRRAPNQSESRRSLEVDYG